MRSSAEVSGPNSRSSSDTWNLIFYKRGVSFKIIISIIKHTDLFLSAILISDMVLCFSLAGNLGMHCICSVKGFTKQFKQTKHWEQQSKTASSAKFLDHVDTIGVFIYICCSAWEHHLRSGVPSKVDTKPISFALYCVHCAGCIENWRLGFYGTTLLLPWEALCSAPRQTATTILLLLGEARC